MGWGRGEMGRTVRVGGSSPRLGGCPKGPSADTAAGLQVHDEAGWETGAEKHVLGLAVHPPRPWRLAMARPWWWRKISR